MDLNMEEKTIIPDELAKKYEYLKQYLKDLGSLAVGFSGGVDSSFLLAAAHEVLGDKAVAVTGADASVPERELKEAADFCRERGIDGRRAYFAGLSLEEMAANVVGHGFTKDSKPHSVDIRVVHKGDDVILRIKDDCIPFDPAERKEIMDPKDRMKGAGIRLVYKVAKDIQYQNILGLNVLTIRI